MTFPLYNADGNPIQLYGRRVDNGQRNQGKHFYLPWPHGGVFNLEAFGAWDELILCESIIDALTFWVNGYRNVTTIYGTNGLTDELLDAFKVHDIKRVLIAFDNDEAGNKASEKHGEAFARLGIERFRLGLTPAANDINNYARIAGQDGGNLHDWLGVLIRNATWLGKGDAPALTTPAPDFLQRHRDEQAAKAAADESSAGAAKEIKAPAVPVEPIASEKASSLAAEIPGVEVAGEPSAAEPPKETPIASPAPAPPTTVEAEVKENEIVIPIGNRVYRVRGLARNSSSVDTMKVNVLARREERFHVDTFDLYAARARAVFIKEAAHELGFDGEVIKRDLGKVLLKLEQLQDEQTQLLDAVKAAKFELSDIDKQAALDLLKQPNLIERILADFDAVGVVGEQTNKLVGYLAATSRKLDKPLAVVIQSSSAAGKSSLMDGETLRVGSGNASRGVRLGIRVSAE